MALVQGLASWDVVTKLSPGTTKHSLGRAGWRIPPFERIRQDMCLRVLTLVSHLSVGHRTETLKLHGELPKWASCVVSSESSDLPTKGPTIPEGSVSPGNEAS